MIIALILEHFECLSSLYSNDLLRFKLATACNNAEALMIQRNDDLEDQPINLTDFRDPINFIEAEAMLPPRVILPIRHRTSWPLLQLKGILTNAIDELLVFVPILTHFGCRVL